jgi:hypothetical protein
LTEAEAAYERVKGQYEEEDAQITKRRQAERPKHESRIATLREARDAADAVYRTQVRRAVRPAT